MKALSQVNKELMSSPIVLQICKELGHPIDIIHGIPIDFVELDVSAKTIDSKVYLNEDLLKESFEVIMRYAIHEITHALQHMNREHLDHDPFADDEYLDREDERDAFSNQIKYQLTVEDPSEVTEYVEELVDYHNVPKEEREEKIEELMNG